MNAPGPFLSVVVPAHNGAQVLRQSLAALLASDLPRPLWELIVVDDASSDHSPAVAAEYADLVVRLAGHPRGPAYARNRGVEASRGEVVVFVDADVCVHRASLGQLAAAFAADATLDAVFGSYDAEPTSPGLVSQFRNLLHHYVHHLSPGEAETFWAGCGAVRRAPLVEVGLMDAWHFARPQIEDIELGRRLRQHGYRIVLRPDIQCTHLKRWTLAKMITTDFRDRGMPWMRLLLIEGPAKGPATLNLKVREKVCTALVGLGGLSLLAALVLLEPLLLVLAALPAAGVFALNLHFYRFLAARRGRFFALRAVPLHLIFYFVGGCAALAGILLHLGRRVPVPPPHIAREVETHRGDWPPPADRPVTGVWSTQRTRARH